MKRIGVILLLAIALCLGGCQKDSRREDVNNWCMEDMKFYDYEGKPVWELTIDNRKISLRDKAGLQTYRGVKIGDDAKEILSQYNMDDFIYEIVRFLYKGIIIKHNKTEPTYTKTSLFLCEKRRFFMARTEKGVVATI